MKFKRKSMSHVATAHKAGGRLHNAMCGDAQNVRIRTRPPLRLPDERTSPASADDAGNCQGRWPTCLGVAQRLFRLGANHEWQAARATVAPRRRTPESRLTPATPPPRHCQQSVRPENRSVLGRAMAPPLAREARPSELSQLERREISVAVPVAVAPEMTDPSPAPWTPSGSVSWGT